MISYHRGTTPTDGDGRAACLRGFGSRRRTCRLRGNTARIGPVREKPVIGPITRGRKGGVGEGSRRKLLYVVIFFLLAGSHGLSLKYRKIMKFLSIGTRRGEKPMALYGFLFSTFLLWWRSLPNGLVSSKDFTPSGWLSAVRLSDVRLSLRDKRW